MAFLTQSLQPQYARALEWLPPSLAFSSMKVIGGDLTVLSLLLALAAGWLLLKVFRKKRNLPPRVPGVPILGNVLQIGNNDMHRTLTSWTEKHGNIYSIRIGMADYAVITAPELAKEAMVTKYSQIPNRKLPTAWQILTRDKAMVAFSDYGEEYRSLKKLLVANLLGQAPQKTNRFLRERYLNDTLDRMVKQVLSDPAGSAKVDVRDYIRKNIFPFSVYQVFGRDPDTVHVPELSATFTRWELFDIFITDPFATAVKYVDWRDLFPSLKPYVSNNSLEKAVRKVDDRRNAVIRALIAEQRQLLAKKKAPDCYLDFLLSQTSYKLSEKQLEQSTWEPVIEGAEPISVALEWTMYELAKNQEAQEKVYQELKSVVGDRMVTEDDLPKLIYLQACIKETLRKYPQPLLPPRHVDEDLKIGGYDVPQGWQIIVNVYGINNDAKRWDNPQKWDPERVLHDDKLDLGFKDFRMLPFGAGKRMCAGILQSMYIIPLNIASFIQHFSWKLAPEDTRVEETPYFSNLKVHPLQAIATPRRGGISKRLNA